MKNACDAKLLRRSFRFPGLEILATVVVKFTASPHSVFVGDRVRLWPSHYIRPFALGALEGIDYRGINLAVGNDGSHPSHSNSFSRSDASRVPAPRACVIASGAVCLLQLGHYVEQHIAFYY